MLFCDGVLAGFASDLVLKRRLHEVNEKTEYIIDYIERVSFIFGDGIPMGVYLGCMTGKISLNTLCCLNWAGGNGVLSK